LDRAGTQGEGLSYSEWREGEEDKNEPLLLVQIRADMASLTLVLRE
jgi:hypothetical protein